MENNTTIPTIPIRRPASQTSPAQPSIVEESKYPTEMIPLPSKGWFYPEGTSLAGGQVEIKMMTAKEEDILTNENFLKRNIVFEKLLRSLIVDKTIDISDILVMDHNAIMVAARRLAYGDTYTVKITCPRCDVENIINIDMSTMNEKEVDLEKFAKGVNRFEFILPISKKKVEIKALTQKDVELIDLEIKHQKKVNKDVSSEVTTRLKHVIVSLDGDEDKNTIRRFVDTEMLARDARELRKFISQTLPGLDIGFDFECSNCAHTERMDVPFTVQFFWPET